MPAPLCGGEGSEGETALSTTAPNALGTGPGTRPHLHIDVGIPLQEPHVQVPHALVRPQERDVDGAARDHHLQGMRLPWEGPCGPGANAAAHASAPSVPRGLRLQNFWPAFGGDHRGALGGGGGQTTPPPPFRPPLPSNTSLGTWFLGAGG